jgi:hypothetical protein
MALTTLPCATALACDSDDDVTLVKGGDGNDQSLVRFDDSHVTGDERSNDSNLPSHVLSDSDIAHLTIGQRKELLNSLDDFSEFFSDKPGFCDYVEHRIQVCPDFKPKRLREYRVPELLKSEVQRQIDILINDGFIVPSNRSMASPLVCILKGKAGKAGVRLAIDCRYANVFTVKDAYIMPNMNDLLQKVGSANYITTADCPSGYWQLPVRLEDRWLTAFAYDGGLSKEKSHKVVIFHVCVGAPLSNRLQWKLAHRFRSPTLSIV